MLTLLAGTGIAAAAGLNAFIPLVVVGLLARFTDTIVLPSGFEWISSWPAIIIFSMLLLAEVILDKIPGVDHVNDIIQTAVRPAVGAVTFAATAGAESLENTDFWHENSWLAIVAGAIVALTVHGGKAASRPAINAATGGTGSPVASFAEDAVSVSMSFAAIFMPWLILVFLAFIGFAVYRVVTFGRRRRKRRAMREQEQTEARSMRAAMASAGSKAKNRVKDRTKSSIDKTKSSIKKLNGVTASTSSKLHRGDKSDD